MFTALAQDSSPQQHIGTRLGTNLSDRVKGRGCPGGGSQRSHFMLAGGFVFFFGAKFKKRLWLDEALLGTILPSGFRSLCPASTIGHEEEEKNNRPRLTVMKHHCTATMPNSGSKSWGKQEFQTRTWDKVLNATCLQAYLHKGQPASQACQKQTFTSMPPSPAGNHLTDEARKRVPRYHVCVSE